MGNLERARPGDYLATATAAGREPRSRWERAGSRRRSRAREDRWSKTGEDLSSRSSGGKRRKKTHDEALFRPHQSRPRWLDPSPEPEKMRRTHSFVVLQVYETIFQRLFRPRPAVTSPSETTDVKSVSSSPCPDLSLPLSKLALSGKPQRNPPPEKKAADFEGTLWRVPATTGCSSTSKRFYSSLPTRSHQALPPSPLHITRKIRTQVTAIYLLPGNFKRSCRHPPPSPIT